MGGGGGGGIRSQLSIGSRRLAVVLLGWPDERQYLLSADLNFKS